jgi:hypothetical protein
MSNASLEFGVDYLWAMRELQNKGSTNKEGGFVDFISGVLLVIAGFSPEEKSEADHLFWTRNNNNTLGFFEDAIERLKRHSSNSPAIKRTMISSFASIIQIQEAQITPEQKSFLYYFQNIFDMKPSEFQEAFARGEDIAVVLLSIVMYERETAKRSALAKEKVSTEKTSEVKERI